MLLVAGIVFVLLAGWYVWYLFLYRPAVEYPEDWPLDYVTVPDGAWANEAPELLGGKLIDSPSVPWPPPDVDSRPFQMRKWRVGFDFKGTLHEACSDLEKRMKSHDFLRVPSYYPIRQTYCSPDFLYSVSVFHQERHLDVFNYLPESWALEITEFSSSVESLSIAQSATPIE